MKGLFVLALAFVAVAVVYGDTCQNTQECVAAHITSCSHHTHVVCDAGNCHCTGGPTDHTCTQQSDCPMCGPLNHQHAGHCIDGQCHCKKV